MKKRAEIASLLQKDALLALSGLAVTIALAWGTMIRMSLHMAGTRMNLLEPSLMHWGGWDIAHLFIMWVVMMAAMMLPAATPMIIVFMTVNRHRGGLPDLHIPTGLFILGYLAVWAAYSILATLAQWGLHIAALLTHTLVIRSSLLGGVLLLAAGIFQWTPFRDACMSKCRSPLGFIMTEWREGHCGALIMGLKHGLFCLGCCWLLMTLSLVLGVMNMIWMAALTAFMFLEKVINNKWISRMAGLALVVWGLSVVAGIPHPMHR